MLNIAYARFLIFIQPFRRSSRLKCAPQSLVFVLEENILSTCCYQDDVM